MLQCPCKRIAGIVTCEAACFVSLPGLQGPDRHPQAGAFQAGGAWPAGGIKMLAAAWARGAQLAHLALLAHPPTPNTRPANLPLWCSCSTSTSQMRACSSTPTSRTWCVDGCRRQGLHPAMLNCRQSKLLGKPCFATAGMHFVPGLLIQPAWLVWHCFTRVQKGAMTVPELSEGLDLISVKSHNWWAASYSVGCSATELRVGVQAQCVQPPAWPASHPPPWPPCMSLPLLPAAGMCKPPAHSLARAC